MNKIVVIGSSNTDMVVRSERLPRPGESVIGGGFMMAGGGKGANQAVAVARMGHRVLFAAAVGNDMFGDAAVAAYKRFGIDTTYIARKDTPSGVALIMVDGAGQNSISVALGANNTLTVEDVMPALEQVESGDIVLLQLEIPMETVDACVAVAAAKGARVVLNPAPAAVVSEHTLSKLYLITPNQTEAQTLTGVDVTDEATAQLAAQVLVSHGVERVVITMGSAGAYLYEEGKGVLIPACKVSAVDTTAAGDVYNGALCAALAEGQSLQDALKFATKASAISVTRVGAQPSVPTREEVDNF
ncbi:MAG: ribokinase [Alistipes sp.]|nr:ribokinase [Alistipes sp.]MBQ2418959.1 ribokinase [Alistipes sp.]